VVAEFRARTHHRDTEHTEKSQKNDFLCKAGVLTLIVSMDYKRFLSENDFPLQAQGQLKQ
jgi:hypothetical protein